MEIVASKTCRRCEVSQPVSEFSIRKVSRDGRHLYCRQCVKFLNTEMHLVKKGLLVRVPKRQPVEKVCIGCNIAFPVSNFYTTSRGSRVELYSRCKDCWRVYSRERMIANPKSRETRKASTKAWRLANPEKAAANHRRYRQSHPEKVAEWGRRWQAANPERAKAHRVKRVATKKQATVIEFSSQLLADRMAYFGNKCWMCGGPFEEVDHVKPLSKNGLHVLSNLRPACASCNNWKHAKWYGVTELHRFIRT